MEKTKCENCGEIRDPSLPHYCVGFNEDQKANSNEQQPKKDKDWVAIISICLGIASVFLWDIWIIPVLAIIFGVIGLIICEKKVKAGVGLTLGVIFLILVISRGPIMGIFSNISPSNVVPQSLSKLELYQKPCDSLPNVPFYKGVAPTATIDEGSLIVRSESPAIYGTFSNASGISIVMWKGVITLSPILSDTPSEIKSIYSDAGDHGGGLWTCPIGSASGRYFDKIWIPLQEGDYTVGVYTRNSVYTSEGFQGYTPSILLATGILKVMPK